MKNTHQHPRANARSQAGLLAAAPGRDALASVVLVAVVLVLVLIRIIGGI